MKLLESPQMILNCLRQPSGFYCVSSSQVKKLVINVGGMADFRRRYIDSSQNVSRLQPPLEIHACDPLQFAVLDIET